jgi:hypothetical protein
VEAGITLVFYTIYNLYIYISFLSVCVRFLFYTAELMEDIQIYYVFVTLMHKYRGRCFGYHSKLNTQYFFKNMSNIYFINLKAIPSLL